MDRGHARGVSLRLATALTIAGSDSGGGAGIQADLKTFAALGVYGASVVTALTAQNTKGVRAIHYPPPAIVATQIEAVLDDLAVAAIKIGMLGTVEIVAAVASALPSPSGKGIGDERPPPFIVYDPVMAASSGDVLSGAGFVEVVRRQVLPLVDCLTPNLAEVAALLDEQIARSEADMARQAEALLKLGPRAALIKGGHLDGDEAVDLLATAEGVRRYAAPRIASPNLHGTGCTLSSAIAANVVHGLALAEAVAAAKTFVGEAIERGRQATLGEGAGPLIQATVR
jgi:hydroxymethylpyrimidine/phosphomethylpyrimidine kinase